MIQFMANDDPDEKTHEVMSAISEIHQDYLNGIISPLKFKVVIESKYQEKIFRSTLNMCKFLKDKYQRDYKCFFEFPVIVTFIDPKTGSEVVREY